VEKGFNEAMVSLADVEAQEKLYKTITDKIAKLEK